MTPGVTLITGATGFAGSHLLDHLAGRAPIVAWHRPGGRPAGGAAPDLRWQAVDLRDRDSVRAAVAGMRPARVFHLAGAAQVDTSWASVVPHLETNVLATHHLLDALRRAATPCRVLVVTSALVYEAGERALDEEAPRRPATPYGLSKLAEDELAHQAAAEDGLDVVIARPFNHAGPRQHPAFALSSFARQIARIEAGLQAPEIAVGNLEPRRDVTDVRDVVDAYELLMEAGVRGRAYNVCSGAAPRIRDLLDGLIAAARTPVRVVVDPARVRPVDVPVLLGDATRIRGELGWTPRVPLATTLADTLDWWRAEVAAGRAG